MEHKSHFDALEEILDQTNINEVVKLLAHICYKKAKHVRSNWQDETLAKAWEHNGSKLGDVEAKLRRTY